MAEELKNEVVATQEPVEPVSEVEAATPKTKRTTSRRGKTSGKSTRSKKAKAPVEEPAASAEGIEISETAADQSASRISVEPETKNTEESSAVESTPAVAEKRAPVEEPASSPQPVEAAAPIVTEQTEAPIIVETAAESAVVEVPAEKPAKNKGTRRKPRSTKKTAPAAAEAAEVAVVEAPTPAPVIEETVPVQAAPEIPIVEETVAVAAEPAPEKPKSRRGRSKSRSGRAKAAIDVSEAAVEVVSVEAVPSVEEAPAAESVEMPPPPPSNEMIVAAIEETQVSLQHPTPTIPVETPVEAPVAVPIEAPAKEQAMVTDQVVAQSTEEILVTAETPSEVVVAVEEPVAPAKRSRRNRSRGRGRGKSNAAAAAAEAAALTPETPSAAVEELSVSVTEDIAQVETPVAPAPTRQGRDRGRSQQGHRPNAQGFNGENGRPRVTPTKEIIVNVEPRETRIALIEDQRLMELRIEREERVVGSIYKGRVANVLPGMDAAFVDIGLERNAFLYVGDILPEAADMLPSARRRDLRNLKIKDMIKPNQEILIQVVKAPRGTKGARVSTRISLPGRYIVLMPDSDNLGISRKVDDPAERDRLKKIGERIRPKNFGVIIRTEAEGQGEAELRQDVELILKLWNQVQEKAAATTAPRLVHQDLSIIFKTIRDVFSEDVSKLIIDSPSDYEKASELVHYISPKLESRLVLYEDPEPIFERYAIESEIERLLRPKVWLKSGGYLSIDQTEALTTVDVNTGKFIGSTSLSETILKTNLDAVEEISRQLRLRDIGGIIIIDFIDMASPKDRNMVMSALDKALKTDRTRTKIAHLSPLGLVEMTRKRTSETVTEVLTEPCPYCSGRGRVSSSETIAIEIERKLRHQCVLTDEEAFLIWAHPEVASQLIGAGGDVVDRLEQELHRALYVRSDDSLHVEEYKILPGDMVELNRQMLPYRGGQVVEARVGTSKLFIPPRAPAWAEGYLVDVINGGEHTGERLKLKLSQVHRSYAFGEVVKPAKVLDKSEPI